MRPDTYQTHTTFGSRFGSQKVHLSSHKMSKPPTFKRNIGLHPRVAIECTKVVNSGIMGFSSLFGPPQVQWGWGVTIDGEFQGKPSMGLHDARIDAEKLSKELTAKENGQTASG
jgi:hypothetical protein